MTPPASGTLASSSPVPASPRVGPRSQAAPRPSRFLADLTRVMRTAAETERTSALAAVTTDAEAEAERLHVAAGERTTERHDAAAADVAATRAWAEAEIARVRTEADERIDARESLLERQLADDAEEARSRAAALVQRADDYRAALGAFHDRLVAIEDPAAFAKLAAAMPLPPNFRAAEGDAPEATDLTAAETEAAEAAGVAITPPAAIVDAGVVTTRVLVDGLRSLAGIATFKQSLARRPGVQSLSVVSNPDGTFTYAVIHRGSVELAPIVTSLSQFPTAGTPGPQVAVDADGTLHVVVADSEAGSPA